jgi:solute carrier family 50 protein (sugar transporter)
MSPIPTMLKIKAQNTPGDFPDTPYIVALTNCTLWIMYALLKGLAQPLYTNVLGAVLNVIWITVFVIFHDNKNRVMLLGKVLVLMALCGAALTAALVIGGQTSQGQQVVGITADIFNAGMYGAPLAALSIVISTRSVECLPFPMVLGCFIASLCWGTYAKWIGDYNMGLPNDAGLILGVVQMIIYAKYRNASPDQAREKLVDGDGKVAPQMA